MPVWVNVKVRNPAAAGYGELRGYPYYFGMWDFGEHEFEVKRDGNPLPKREFRISRGISFWSPDDPSEPTIDRLPIHVQFDFTKPGSYEIKYKHSVHMVRKDQNPKDFVSEWIKLEVKIPDKNLIDEFYRNKISEQPSDIEKLVRDWLPSLLARPDKDVLRAFIRLTQHMDSQVRYYVIYSLWGFDDPLLASETPALMGEIGPSDELARFLSWRRSIFRPVTDDILRNATPYLSSPDSRKLEGAISTLSFVPLRVEGEPGDPADAERRRRNIEAVLAHADHILKSQDEYVLKSLACFLGSAKGDRSREILWQLTERPVCRGQAIICLCWLGDKRDLPKLGNILLTGAVDEAADIAYQFPSAFGDEASPYLLEAMKSANSKRVRNECAKSLMKLNKLEGFLAAKQMIEQSAKGDSSEEGAREYFYKELHDSDGSRETFLKLLQQKIDELSPKRE